MTDTATPPSDVVFTRGLDVFSTVVDRVPPDAWERPSACSGWTTLDVLGHLGCNIEVGSALLRGESPPWPDRERPADAVSGDPGAWWAKIAAEARAALEGADLDLVMGTPMGPRTVADRLAFPAIDLYVHAWDIGHALGIDVEIPEDVIAFTHGYIDPFPPEVVRGAKGAFGPEVEAPADATPAERFLAWTGRNPR